MQKKLSMICFVVWSILIVLILTFGTTIASKISSSISSFVNENIQKLKDVELEQKEYYIVGKTYDINYTTNPNNDYKKGLIFTSLDKDVFSVQDNKKIKVNRFEGDSKVGRLQITSSVYPEFEKIVNLNFKKIYPETVNFTVFNSNGRFNSSGVIHIGLPISLRSSFKSSLGAVTEKEFRYIYDSNYFEEIDTYKNMLFLMPKVDGYNINDTFEDVTTKVQLELNGEIVAEKTLTIKSNEKITSFDDIKFNSIKEKYEDLNELYVDGIYQIGLIKNEKYTNVPFNVSISDPSIATLSSANTLVFHKTGSLDLTVSLDNGFSKTYNINVINYLESPLISNVTFDDDNNIVILNEEPKKIKIEFPTNTSYTKWTYEIIEETAEISHNGYFHQITLNPKKTGNAKLIIKVDDELQEPIILEYNIIVKNNPKSKASIVRTVGKFLAKIAGHFSFFVLQGILAFWMMMNYKGKKMWLNVLLFFSFGLAIASLTEFIQLFIPSRNGCFKDVVLDMLGYLLGNIIAILGYLIIKKKERKKNEKQFED